MSDVIDDQSRKKYEESCEGRGHNMIEKICGEDAIPWCRECNRAVCYNIKPFFWTAP
jgi:hypothetical protein